MDFVERIKKLYLEDSRCESNFRESSREQTSNSLFKVLSDQNIEDIMELDFSKGKGKVIELLKYVPPELLLKEFGEEMVCWVYVNNQVISPYYFQLDRMVGDLYRREELMDQFLQLKKFTNNKTEHFLKKAGSFLKGKDATIVTKTIGIANNFDCSDKFKFIQQNYFLIEGLLQQDIGQQIEWRQLLENRSRGIIPNWNNKEDNYSLESLVVDIGFEGSDPKWMDRRQKDTEMVFQIYLDAPLGIILKYKEEPQAVVAFTPIDQNTIQIYQLQGVVPKKLDDEENIIFRGNSRGLSSFDWQAFLIEVVNDLAKRYKFREIAIQSGYNNSWIKSYDDKTIHLPSDVAIRKYDAVAERLGFVQRGDKNWYRSVVTKLENSEYRGN